MTAGLSCACSAAVAPSAEEDVNHLPRHVERSQHDPGQHQIMRHRETDQSEVACRISSFVQAPAKKSGTPLSAIIPIA